MELIQGPLTDELQSFGQIVLPDQGETVALGMLNAGEMCFGIIAHEEDQLIAAALIVEVHAQTVIQAEIAAVAFIGIEIVVIGIAHIGLSQPHAGGDMMDRLSGGKFGLIDELLTLCGGRLFNRSGSLDLLLGGLRLLRGFLQLLGATVQRKKGETKRRGNNCTAFHHVPPLQHSINILRYHSYWRGKSQEKSRNFKDFTPLTKKFDWAWTFFRNYCKLKRKSKHKERDPKWIF